MKFCSIDGCSTPNFSKDTKTGLPYCRSHQYKRTDYDRRTIMQKALDKNKSLNSKVRGLVDKQEENNTILNLWYLARKYEMTGKCEECGAYTNKNDEKYYRWSVCHCVPKSLVPSVATHFENWIELCQEHHQEYDANFERAKRLKCFPLIKRKFETFKHLIPNEELRKVNPYLNT